MRYVLGGWTAIMAAAVAWASDPPAIPRDQVPAALAPAVARGEAAMDAFRDRLSARLGEALRRGAAHAIQVCRADAAAIARRVGEEYRVTIGRTSERVRNPANVPPPWAAAHVLAAHGKKAAALGTQVVDLGERVGVLRPLSVAPACTRCHGAPEAIDGEVRAELARAYPGDRATGFLPGDLRGFMWVEVPKR